MILQLESKEQAKKACEAMLAGEPLIIGVLGSEHQYAIIAVEEEDTAGVYYGQIRLKRIITIR